jgi:hypothetical protein
MAPGAIVDVGARAGERANSWAQFTGGWKLRVCSAVLEVEGLHYVWLLARIHRRKRRRTSSSAQCVRASHVTHVKTNPPDQNAVPDGFIKSK